MLLLARKLIKKKKKKKLMTSVARQIDDVDANINIMI